MRLSFWSYENPAFVGICGGAMSLKGAEILLVAPRGDSYINVLFSVYKRSIDFMPVTLCTIEKRELSEGAEDKIKEAIENTWKDSPPRLLFIVTTCTAELLKIDFNAIRAWAEYILMTPVIFIESNSFTETESEALDRFMAKMVDQFTVHALKTKVPSVNLIGPYYFGFHEQSNLEEIHSLLSSLGIEINSIFPWKASLDNIRHLPAAWANISLSPESSMRTLELLKLQFNQPIVKTIPIGELGIKRFIDELAALGLTDGKLKLSDKDMLYGMGSYIGRVNNFAHSVNAEQLRRRKAFVFGSFTQAVGVTRFLAEELHFPVVAAGTYSLALADRFREELAGIDTEVFITNDFKEVRQRIMDTQPDLILATQMEKHIAADLNIPSAIISPPINNEMFPVSFQPFVGYRGAAHLADLIFNPLTVGLEDNLKRMFGEDEDDIEEEVPAVLDLKDDDLIWTPEALRELKKIPFFVRPIARKSIEEYARAKNERTITLDLMYEAKENAGG
ncbi:MAG: nitrogenase component 1 [Actinomycetota bacterium]|nr:nitrogenase component 1 [Actinomycetota bacterium]